MADEALAPPWWWPAPSGTLTSGGKVMSDETNWTANWAGANDRTAGWSVQDLDTLITQLDSTGGRCWPNGPV
jgi:hypothetical protein